MSVPDNRRPGFSLSFLVTLCGLGVAAVVLLLVYLSVPPTHPVTDVYISRYPGPMYSKEDLHRLQHQRLQGEIDELRFHQQWSELNRN